MELLISLMLYKYGTPTKFENLLDTSCYIIFKKTFRFTGGEIVNEFLMSIGYLSGAHTADCAIYKQVLKTGPLWAGVGK